jgi:hypothetical protein
MRNIGIYVKNIGIYVSKIGIYLSNIGIYVRKIGIYVRNIGIFEKWDGKGGDKKADMSLATIQLYVSAIFSHTIVLIYGYKFLNG